MSSGLIGDTSDSNSVEADLDKAKDAQIPGIRLAAPQKDLTAFRRRRSLKPLRPNQGDEQVKHQK
jgi:hypothetical protein